MAYDAFAFSEFGLSGLRGIICCIAFKMSSSDWDEDIAFRSVSRSLDAMEMVDAVSGFPTTAAETIVGLRAKTDDAATDAAARPNSRLRDIIVV